MIGEQPGTTEEQRGIPFVGESGDIIRGVLKQITDKFSITNSVCCYDDNKKPNQKTINSCKPNYLRLINNITPKVIVLLGAHAHKSMFGDLIPFKCGGVSEVNLGGSIYPVCSCYHPAYLLHLKDDDPNLLNRVEDDFFDAWDGIKTILDDGMLKPPKIETPSNINEIRNILRDAINSDAVVSYDYETWGDVDSLRPELNNEFEILCIGFSTPNGSYCFPYQYPGFFTTKEQNEIKRLWLGFLRGYSGVLINQNSKYEHKCNLVSFKYTKPSTDTMLMMSALDEYANCDLESICKYCGIKWHFYKSSNAVTQSNPKNSPLPDLLNYCGLDALATRISYDTLNEKIYANGQCKLIRQRSQESLVLAHLEINGMHIDTVEADILRDELEEEISKLDVVINSTSAAQKVIEWSKNNIKTLSQKKKVVFNPRSYPQMKYLCLDVLKLKIPQKKGRYSFDKKILESHKHRHEIIKHIVNSRSMKSMIDGFLNKWKDFTGPTGCVHTSFNQTTVVTTRLSSSNPNLQNIKDGIVKKVFTSRFEDGYLINGDFKQLEPRLLAGISGDKGMIKALHDGLDLHKWTGGRIFHTEYDKVDDEQRNLGKRMNLGTMYGQTEFGLSEKTGLSLKEAKELIDTYDRMFPGVTKFRMDCRKMAIDLGYCVDLFGARRHLPEARNADKWKRERALRQSSNFPIQSTGNRFCMISMVELFRLMSINNLQEFALLISTVHDSLVSDSRRSKVVLCAKLMKQAMEIHNYRPYWKDRGVWITADIKVGKNLWEMECVDVN